MIHNEYTGWTLATIGLTNKFWTGWLPDLTLSNGVLVLSALWIIVQIAHKIKHWKVPK